MKKLIKEKSKDAGIIFQDDDDRNVMHIRRDNFIKYSELVLAEGKRLGAQSEHALWVLSRIGQEIEEPDQYKHQIVKECVDLFDVEEKSDKGYFIGSRIYKHFGIK